MCGICGYIEFKAKLEPDESVIQRMTMSMRHRGPNDQGWKTEALDNFLLGFGHARLSILDLSPLGHQPMSFEHFDIVFNGEIYNFLEIRRDLEAMGHRFVSHSDTEVILHAYSQWGESCVQRFIGMFAFVIYDKEKQEVAFFRDRAGVKPLYYYWHENLFIFASELKAFHQHPAFKKNIDFASVDLFMRYGNVPAPYSIFEHTNKLLPGHMMRFSLTEKNIETSKYWDVHTFYNKPRLDLSYEEAKQQLHALLKSAYEYRMVSDVPVGVFLSAGFDSSSVAAILQSNRTEKLKTFTIGFEEGNNEAPFAKQIAEILGTDHSEHYCTATEAKKIIPDLPFIHDEPFADSSAIPTTLVSQFAKQQVDVALSADGGDEVFTGYNSYTALHRKLEQLKYIPTGLYPLSSKLFAVLSIICPVGLKRPKRVFREYADALGGDVNDFICMLHNDVNYDNARLYKGNRYARSFVSRSIKRGTFNEFSELISIATAIDYKDYMQNDILTKVDRATMSVSLEGREPLLDHRIAEFAAQLPQDYKFGSGIKKRILKDIVYDYLPKGLMDRPKTGFSIPIYDWLKNDLHHLIDEYLSEHRVIAANVFDWGYVRYIRKQFLNGSLYDNTELWKLLVFHMWFAQWMK